MCQWKKTWEIKSSAELEADRICSQREKEEEGQVRSACVCSLPTHGVLHRLVASWPPPWQMNATPHTPFNPAGYRHPSSSADQRCGQPVFFPHFSSFPALHSNSSSLQLSSFPAQLSRFP